VDAASCKTVQSFRDGFLGEEMGFLEEGKFRGGESAAGAGCQWKVSQGCQEKLGSYRTEE